MPPGPDPAPPGEHPPPAAVGPPPGRRRAVSSNGRGLGSLSAGAAEAKPRKVGHPFQRTLMSRGSDVGSPPQTPSQRAALPAGCHSAGDVPWGPQCDGALPFEPRVFWGDRYEVVGISARRPGLRRARRIGTWKLDVATDSDQIWSILPLRVAQVVAYESLHVFRDGVSPSYEDPWNSSGGVLTVTFRNVAGAHAALDRLCAAFVRERIPHSRRVNGVTLAKKRRQLAIKVWVRDKAAVDAVRGFIDAACTGLEVWQRTKYVPTKCLLLSVSGRNGGIGPAALTLDLSPAPLPARTQESTAASPSGGRIRAVSPPATPVPLAGLSTDSPPAISCLAATPDVGSPPAAVRRTAPQAASSPTPTPAVAHPAARGRRTPTSQAGSVLAPLPLGSGSARAPAPEKVVPPAPEKVVAPAPEKVGAPAPEKVVAPAPEKVVAPAPEKVGALVPEIPERCLGQPQPATAARRWGVQQPKAQHAKAPVAVAEL